MLFYRLVEDKTYAESYIETPVIPENLMKIFEEEEIEIKKREEVMIISNLLKYFIYII